jgi:hypothetical protein
MLSFDHVRYRTKTEVQKARIATIITLVDNPKEWPPSGKLKRQLLHLLIADKHGSGKIEKTGKAIRPSPFFCSEPRSPEEIRT